MTTTMTMTMRVVDTTDLRHEQLSQASLRSGYSGRFRAESLLVGSCSETGKRLQGSNLLLMQGTIHIGLCRQQWQGSLIATEVR